MVDKLSDDLDRPGVLVLNYGDPAYLSRRTSSLGLSAAEDIFLRLIAYLPFAEAIVVPGRNIIDSKHVFESVELAKSLLRENLIIPERRAGANSFEEVARARNLSIDGRNRAEFLDRHAAHVRVFKWSDLSSAYRTTLLDDLAPHGAFRRVVSGAIKGRLKAQMDRAFEHYEASGAVTPEGFFSAVAGACPEAAQVARRWAMAHYYLTPTRFDDINIRQVPKEAADLLIRGRILDAGIRPPADLAPAEHLREELAIGIGLNDVRENASAYCEAALNVRHDIPEARELFKRIAKESEIRELGRDVSAAMTSELKKQLKIRWLDDKRFSLGVDTVGGLLGGSAGLLLDLYTFVGASLIGATAGAAATSTLKESAVESYDRKNRSWKLAIDRVRDDLAKRTA